MADPGPLLGSVLELDVGAPGHGGFCVARHEGRVVFVRHALPGERVRALVTEDASKSFCRADAIEILTKAAERVVPPCPHAGPGKCGGCDWQHATAAAQRSLKAAVVREQFTRLARLDIDSLLRGVEELPGGMLGWRTRIVFAVDRDGRVGLHRHRSHEIEKLDSCPLGKAGVGDNVALQQRWPGLTGIEAVRGEGDQVSIIGHRPGPGRQARGRRPPDRVEVIEGPRRVRHVLGRRNFDVDVAGFWQVHPAALAAFADALLSFVAPRPGEVVLDLYAGSGALTAVLADAVGPTGRVLGVESARQAVADAELNLADVPWADVRRGRVEVLAEAGLGTALGGPPDVVVLDPPRSGAGKSVMAALLALGPRAIGYVACDPVALARDVRVALEEGWRLSALRAFDAFPMTHHVECVALLEPGDAPPDGALSPTHRIGPRTL